MSDPYDRPTRERGGIPPRVPPRPFASRTRLAIWLAAIILPWLLLLAALAVLFHAAA